MEKPDHRGLNPPSIFLAALVLAVTISVVLPSGAMGGWLLDLLGVALIIAGIGLNVRGSGQFERAGTPVRPGSRGGALVTAGVFSFSRNPMYLGMVAILLGVAIGLGSTWALLAPSMFMGLIQTRFIRMEERILEEEFGAAYVAYRKKVGRWVGRGAGAL